MKQELFTTLNLNYKQLLIRDINKRDYSTTLSISIRFRRNIKAMLRVMRYGLWVKLSIDNGQGFFFLIVNFDSSLLIKRLIFSLCVIGTKIATAIASIMRVI